MKKFLLLLTLAGVATTMASMQAAQSSPGSSAQTSADAPGARACAVLLRKMTRSADADNWRNRMLAWPCMKRANRAVITFAETDRR